MVLWYCTTLLLGILIAAVQVHSQTPGTEDFISIDCGATVNSTDSITGIPYITDDGFIETGVNYNILSDYRNSSLPKQYSTVRSFPDGARNCYTSQPVNQKKKYLVRASFMYGNYDGKNSVKENSPLIFDLHMGVDRWDTVIISDPSTPFTYEAITPVSVNRRISVCLIRINSSSTPFISLLELRPLNDTFYPDYKVILLTRRNLGASADNIIRFPDDPYDRIWKPFNITVNQLTTTKTVERNKTDAFDVPPLVLQTASVGANGSIGFYWDPVPDIHFYDVFFHFSELELLSEKYAREADVYISDFRRMANYTPTYLKQGAVYDTGYSGNGFISQFSINATKRATKPPLLNAYEIYYETYSKYETTYFRDVEAILQIKAVYKVKKDWMGDPCSPDTYRWHGLNCSSGALGLTITAINLSSSGLFGDVSTLFSRLPDLQFLDLSYNNLSGKIPDSLASISNLQVLNLTGNCITEVPVALIEKQKEGSLTLGFDQCNDTTATKKKKKKITTPIIVVLSVVPAILLLVVVILIVWRIRRKTQAVRHEVVQPPLETWQLNVDREGRQLSYSSFQSNVDHKDGQLPLESRRFTYLELENITKKFSRTLGKGGFGTVFHGFLEDGIEVAVKMCSLSSEQAPNLFLAEVENLSSVRHKNLVSLVGYCVDKGRMAVVYEYMALGSLEDHLRGKAGTGRSLSWAERLQIVIDAAQGLDYLYNGCPMPIIHRDVKTSNILLGQNLEAKISDFGLSKAFHSNLQTHVSMTALAFTPGYVDPMSLHSWKFNEKTDVYSFGVVILETITGEPPIRDENDLHVIERVQLNFEAGDINAIIDPRLQGIHNNESVWKATELAMRCTAREVDQRPKMAEVVIQLKESLEREIAERSKSTTTESQIMPFTKESTICSPLAR